MSLAFKVLVAPILIGLVSLAGRRWGPVVSGWLVGLPLTAGPVALFLALEQGAAFEAHSAEGALLGLASVAGFSLAYSWCAFRLGWLPAIVVSWGVFLALTAALEMLTLPLLLAFVGVILCLTVTLLVLPGGHSQVVAQKTPPWETLLRMLVVVLLLLALTGGATLLGPQLSGLFSTFPTYASILVVFTHRFQGALPACRLLRGLVAGAFSTACFFLVLSGMIMHLGLWLSLLLACLTALIMHSLSLFLLQRKPVPIKQISD